MHKKNSTNSSYKNLNKAMETTRTNPKINGNLENKTKGRTGGAILSTHGSLLPARRVSVPALVEHYKESPCPSRAASHRRKPNIASQILNQTQLSSVP